MSAPRLSSICAAKTLIGSAWSCAMALNAFQNGSSRETDVRCPRSVSERFFGLSLITFVPIKPNNALIFLRFYKIALRFRLPKLSCIAVGQRFLFSAGLGFASFVQIDWFHFGPIINSGRTTRSNVSSSTNPRAIASCLRVVPFLCAVLATVVALS